MTDQSMTDGLGPQVKQLRPGQTVTGVYGIIKKRLRSFRNARKGQYLEIEFGDRTGVVPGRVWDDAVAVADRFDEGDVVRVEGTVQTYRNEKQLVVEDLKEMVGDAVPVERFIPSSSRPVSKMEDEFWRLIESVEQPDLAELLTVTFGEPAFYRDYIRYPAGKKVHHSYLHGLLEHSLEVVSLLGNEAARNDELNLDLLVAGGLLHDVGKLQELTLGGTIQYTERGRLVGHVVMGAGMVSERLKSIHRFPEELALHLKHLILSHHGELKYGSPVVPQTVEAVALHHADLFSGRVSQVQSIARKVKGGGHRWSDFDQLLGRYIWMPENPEESDEANEGG